jgi:hypothetical protein
MSIRCLFGAHRASISSIARKGGHYIALCESCARPLEREPDGRWVAAEPLYDRRKTRAA